MRWIGALLLAAAALLAPPGVARDVPAAIAEVRIDELPVEARQTLERIKRGGPYPYRKDGSVFGNRERLLPAQPRGYYTEYTVKTPYSRDRGARRIVAGRGAARNPATSGEYYYTDDHYNSFRRIRE
ncbi:MAG: ribonuclease domain-containing protein [Betaproteobacteria bacterium]